MEPALASIAIGNLIDNALQYSSPDSTISVAVTRDADTITFAIANNGADFTEREAERLIEPFHRGAATRLAGGGTGLGLTIVDAIARAHHGSLTLSPRASGGLVAEFRLPSG